MITLPSTEYKCNSVAHFLTQNTKICLSVHTQATARAKPWVTALAWPRIWVSQSQSFQAKLGQNITTPSLIGWDTCDILAGNGTLWPVTAELIELVQYSTVLLIWPTLHTMWHVTGWRVKTTLWNQVGHVTFPQSLVWPLQPSGLPIAWSAYSSMLSI